MGGRRGGQGQKVGGPSPVQGARKRSATNAGIDRSDALQGMLVLAAATQHAEGSKEAGALQQAQEAVAAAAAAGVPEHLPRGRQESVSSDYSEGQQYDAALRTAQRGALHHESEEEKREKRRLANREAARRMRRRRATHMAAVEEEVEHLSQENSLLLHRLSQLVASHQVVDAENQQLRSELLALRQSVGACLQVGQMDLAGASLAPLAAVGAGGAGLVPACALVPPKAALDGGDADGQEPLEAVPRPPHGVRRPTAGTGIASAVLETLNTQLGLPTCSGGHSRDTENEMTATEEERARYHLGAARDPSFASSGEAAHAHIIAGEAAHAHVGVGRTARKRGTWKPLDD